jgi:phosphoglycolate phosphatase
MLNWQDLFAITCCAEDYQSKPSPEMIKHIASVLDFSNEEIIVVGDSHVDLEMANNAKVAGVGVLTGVSNFETLDSIPHIAILDKAEQLGTILPKL